MVLREAGLVDSLKAGREVRFGLLPEALTDTAAWMHQVASQWDQRLAALKKIAEQLPD